MADDLPEAELDVLAVLWSRGESTAPQIQGALGEQRPMSHGAVFTLLRRLEQKDLVARTDKKIGKAFLYRARARQSATCRRKLNGLVDRLFGGSRIKLVSSLLESGSPTDTELEELESLLGELRRKRSDRS